MKKTMFLAAVVLFGTAPVAAQKTPDFAVGPQYDTTHVYVPQDQYDAFMRSFVATFGGSLSKQGEFQVTPTPSKTKSQLALTPAGRASSTGPLAITHSACPHTRLNGASKTISTWATQWLTPASGLTLTASVSAVIPRQKTKCCAVKCARWRVAGLRLI